MLEHPPARGNLGCRPLQAARAETLSASNFGLRFCKNMVSDPPPPPTHTFLKQPFLTDFKKYTHTHPPTGTKFWRIGPKVHKTQEKCQNPPCWRIPNVPERYWTRSSFSALKALLADICALECGQLWWAHQSKHALRAWLRTAPVT